MDAGIPGGPGVDGERIEMEPARPPGESLPVATEQARPAAGAEEREAPGLSLDPGLSDESARRRAKAAFCLRRIVEALEALATGPVARLHGPVAWNRGTVLSTP